MNDRLVLYRWTGALGVLATCAFLAKTFLKLPDLAHLLCVLGFGPLVVAGSYGMSRFMQADRPRPSMEVARVFNQIAGSFHVAMISVQLTTLHFLREDIREATTEAAKSTARAVLAGVFTVQLGLCFIWDLFIALGSILFGLALARARPLAGRLLGAAGLLIAGGFLVMKIRTFPVPPAEAGLFDAGPILGGWYLAFSLFILATARSRAAIEPA